MYETKKQFNKEAKWLSDYIDAKANIIPAKYTSITSNEVRQATSTFASWKSPGIDKIQNFWWKNLTNIHSKIATLLDEIFCKPEECPAWLTTGRTSLVAENKETENPSNYRPIICLPLIYKIQTKTSQLE